MKSIFMVVICLGLTMTPAAAWKCMGDSEVACGDSYLRDHNFQPREPVQQARTRPAKRNYTRRSTAPRRTARRSNRSNRSARSGMASYYWQGQRTASGARFNPDGLTAAHRTLPFGTRVRVTNKRNGRSVVVTINDRGPFIRGRVIDLSRGAARVINMTGAGVAPVSLDVQ